MLMTVNRVLRRQRRKVLLALAVAALAAGALTVQSALMGDGGMGHHMSDGAALCLTVAGCAFVAVGPGFAVRRLVQRPVWALPAVLAPAVAFVAVRTPFLVRAGPPPLLQVFQL